MSTAALEAKFAANCAFGGWDANRARGVVDVLRALHRVPRLDLSTMRG